MTETHRPCARCGSIYGVARYYVGASPRRYLCRGCAKILGQDQRVSRWRYDNPTREQR